MLIENADDPEMYGEAAHMLRTLAEQSAGLYAAAPKIQIARPEFSHSDLFLKLDGQQAH